MAKKRIGLQRGTAEILLPATEDDYDFIREIAAGQILEVEIVGGWQFKQRSYKQLSLLMAAIRVVVANTENPNWSTIAKAKMSLKNALGYIDPDATVYDENTGRVILKYRSFGFADLKHMEACNLFDRAFVCLADHLRIPAEELIDAAMRRDYPRGLP